jgi:glucan phosphoethanolaminetransferase (alkaline phosphatase superfamily)
MSDESGEQPIQESRLKRRLILGGSALIAAVAAWFIGAAVLPRWWAQRLGDLVDGRLTVGSLVGVVLGVLFTLLPIAVLLSGWRFRRTWRRAIGALILALIAAAPNLLTLGIVIGDGNAAHAGERILDVDGPGIRGGTLVGVVIGVLIAIALRYLVWSRARNVRRAKEFKAELRNRDDE